MHYSTRPRKVSCQPCNQNPAFRFKNKVHSRRRFVKALLLLTFLWLFCVVSFGQTDPMPATPLVEDVYLAKDNGEGKAGDQATEFRTTDIPIYCVILLDTTAKTTVKMNFVAVSVAGVKPDTKVVTASYTTKEGQNRVNFTGRPEGTWTPGKYRVDLFLDGKAATTVEFEIKSSGGNAVTGAKGFQEVSPPKQKPRKRSGSKPQ